MIKDAYSRLNDTSSWLHAWARAIEEMQQRKKEEVWKALEQELSGEEYQDDRQD